MTPLTLRNMAAKLEEADPLSVDDMEEKHCDTVSLEEATEEMVEVRIYSCDFCDFKTGADVFCHRHLWRIHKLRPCNLCHFYADNLPNLNFHQETEHGVDPFQDQSDDEYIKCDVCETEFKTHLGLKIHIEAKHKGVRFSCEECEFQTSYKTSLKLHIDAKHKGVEFSCDKCEFKTGYRKLLNRHMKSGRHVEKEKIKRTITNSIRNSITRRKSYVTQVRYSQFIAVKDGEEDEKRDLKAPHTPDEDGLIWCQYVDCDFRSKYVPNVTRHEMSRHRGVKYKCDKCEFTARQRVEVLVHSNSKHEGIIYKCELCDFKTPWKSFFKKHKMEKHGAGPGFIKRDAAQPYSQRRLSSKNLQSNDEGTPYTCPECDFSTTIQQSMNYHIKKRSGSQFKCDLCDYKNCFLRGLAKHKKKIHQIIQSGNNSSCSKCGFSSEIYQVMNYHLKKSNLKTTEVFKCDFCDYKNCFERNLNKHKIKMHKVDPEKKCPNCDFSSPKNQLMKYHMRRGTTGELFSCKHCDYKNCSKKGLNFHVLKYHEKMRPTLRKHRKCPNCDFKSSYPEVLDAHIGEGKEEQVQKCDRCEYKNCSEEGLTKHKQKKHKTENKTKLKFKCSKCGRLCQSINGLRAHKSICIGLRQETFSESKVQALEEPPAEKFCDKCDYKTRNSEDYYEHVIEHLPTNTSEPQKLTNPVRSVRVRESASEEPRLPHETSGFQKLEATSGLTIEKVGSSSGASENISAFKEKLKSKMKQFSEKGKDELGSEKVSPGQNILEPGEIVRDTEGQVVTDAPVKLEPTPSTEPDYPGELHDSPEEPDVGATDAEVDAAVDFLMSLGDNTVEEAPTTSTMKPEPSDQEFNFLSQSDDYGLVTSEIKCDFGCGHSFSNEESLYIHITDFHNDF